MCMSFVICKGHVSKGEVGAVKLRSIVVKLFELRLSDSGNNGGVWSKSSAKQLDVNTLQLLDSCEVFAVQTDVISEVIGR